MAENIEAVYCGGWESIKEIDERILIQLPESDAEEFPVSDSGRKQWNTKFYIGSF